MKELSYKGFTGSIEPSVEDDCLFGEILFINDHIVYEGQTVSEITQAFQQAVDLYLDYCARNNKEPSKPYSGTFNVRPGPDLHRSAAQKAHKLGISLNEYVSNCIRNDIAAEVSQTDVASLMSSWASFAAVNQAAHTSGNVVSFNDAAVKKTQLTSPSPSFNADDAIAKYLN